MTAPRSPVSSTRPTRRPRSWLSRRRPGPRLRAGGDHAGRAGAGMLGMVEDVLVDRSFVARSGGRGDRTGDAGRCASASPHQVENALAAAALAPRHGVAPDADARGFARSPRPCTASQRSAPSPACVTWTTRRLPAGTPPAHPCAPTTRWCGSQAAKAKVKISMNFVRQAAALNARCRAVGPRSGPHPDPASRATRRASRGRVADADTGAMDGGAAGRRVGRAR